jgi:hypothetical protein
MWSRCCPISVNVGQPDLSHRAAARWPPASTWPIAAAPLRWHDARVVELPERLGGRNPSMIRRAQRSEDVRGGREMRCWNSGSRAGGGVSPSTRCRAGAGPDKRRSSRPRGEVRRAGRVHSRLAAMFAGSWGQFRGGSPHRVDVVESRNRGRSVDGGAPGGGRGHRASARIARTGVRVVVGSARGGDDTGRQRLSPPSGARGCGAQREQAGVRGRGFLGLTPEATNFRRCAASDGAEGLSTIGAPQVRGYSARHRGVASQRRRADAAGLL